MRTIEKSSKLDNVLYDIRGPVLEEAKRLESEGYQILRLNIGNPAPFGLYAPDEVIHDMILNLPQSEGYSDSKGLFSARKAIMQYCQQKNIAGVDIDDIYTGNGVSECIVMAMQALCDNRDEVLIPAPDYPLWTAAVNLAGGKAVHYLCDEAGDWQPDAADIKRKITANTRAIVVINPNNPTGALYEKDVLKQLVQIAQEHDLVLFSDEIYDKITYDGAEHISTASLCDDILCVTMNGLSKTYRVAGFRAGWMVLSGNKSAAKGYIEGIDMLASMRLCSNVPGQSIIQTALGGRQSIYAMTQAGGRLHERRRVCFDLISQIPGLSCVEPKAAFYLFPKLDQKRFALQDDQQMVLDLLAAERVLVVQGTGFNWPAPDHFRIVFLPPVEQLTDAITRIGRFLSSYHQ